MLKDFELNLDDIMEEFHTDPEEQLDEEIKEWKTAVFGEETKAAPEETVKFELPAETEEPEELPADELFEDEMQLDEAVFEEAEKEPIRLDEEDVTSDTIRLDTILPKKGQVRNAEPVTEDTCAIPVVEDKESFTQQWEPEYEQPMGEYKPVQQVIAHPRSRLHELKKKLVAGPEKRYYALSEQGMGKLKAAIFFSIVIVLLSAFSTAMYAMGRVQAERMPLLVFVQLFCMMVSALLGSNQLIEGISDLFHKRFSLNTLLVLTLLACTADGVICLKELRVPCCAAFCLEMTMSLWSTYQRRYTELSQMDTMRKAVRLGSVVAKENYYDGQKGFLRGEGQVEDFMDTYQQLPQPEKRMDFYSLIAAGVSLLLGVAAGVFYGVSAALQVFAVTLIAAVPVTSFVAVSRPMAVLQRRFRAIGTVLCGWQGVEGMSGKAVFPVGFEDLLPAGTCRMNGVKFFGDRDPDEIVSYCTALMEAENGGLASLFVQVLESRNGYHYDAQDLVRYEGGIGGSVQGESVLVGNLSFLKSMEVELPEGIRVNQAVCVAIEGELCGLFVLSLERFHGAGASMDTLCSQSKLSAVLTAGDFVLTESLLRGKLAFNTRKLIMPDVETRLALANEKPEEDAKALALITGEGFMPYAYAVTGARALRSSARVGTLISIIGGGLGIAMMIALTVLGALKYLTPANMFLYQLVWMIPGLLITHWTRNI